jgi:hypothetical protein
MTCDGANNCPSNRCDLKNGSISRLSSHRRTQLNVRRDNAILATSQYPEGGQRLRLLDLITGTQRSDRLARHVTKNTYVLANSLQGFRDFGVHPKATSPQIGAAYSALHVSIELAATVTKELTSHSA